VRHRWFPPCALLAAIITLTPAGAAEPGRRVDISVSNFRFCRAAPCQPQDQAYVRGASGNVDGTDNKAAFIEIHPGDTVVWTYKDDTCDQLTVDPRRCPGHELVFETGQESQGKLGLLPSRQGHPSISWRVPDNAAPGHVLRYYCDLDDHWAFGLTGALLVAGS
jgi:plastocyanin